MSALFSLEILQAGEVKGLILLSNFDHKLCLEFTVPARIHLRLKASLSQ